MADVREVDTLHRVLASSPRQKLDSKAQRDLLVTAKARLAAIEERLAVLMQLKAGMDTVVTVLEAGTFGRGLSGQHAQGGLDFIQIPLTPTWVQGAASPECSGANGPARDAETHYESAWRIGRRERIGDRGDRGDPYRENIVHRADAMQPTGAGVEEFEALKPGDDVKLIVRVDLLAGSSFAATLLSKKTEADYNATGTTLRAKWDAQTKFVMGLANDLKPGSVAKSSACWTRIA